MDRHSPVVRAEVILPAAAREVDPGRVMAKGAATLSVKHYEKVAAAYSQVIDMPDAGMADVTFLVGTRKFGGIRRVLALRCIVFERMLLGEFAEGRPEATCNPISLPEFDSMAVAFRDFLFYLHAGSATLESTENVMGLFEISKYFGVNDLLDACTEFLQEVEITPDMCIELCIFAVKHEMWGLTERVVNFIAEHADVALHDSEHAARLPHSFLRFLYQSNNIEVLELTLVQLLPFLVPEQQKELLPFIRLPRISAADMMKTVVPSGLFDKDACLAALAYREDRSCVELPAELTAARERSTRCVSKAGRRSVRAARAGGGHWGQDYLMQLRTEETRGIVTEDILSDIVEDEI